MNCFTYCTHATGAFSVPDITAFYHLKKKKKKKTNCHMAWSSASGIDHSISPCQLVNTLQVTVICWSGKDFGRLGLLSRSQVFLRPPSHKLYFTLLSKQCQAPFCVKSIWRMYSWCYKYYDGSPLSKMTNREIRPMLVSQCKLEDNSGLMMCVECACKMRIGFSIRTG